MSMIFFFPCNMVRKTPLLPRSRQTCHLVTCTLLISDTSSCHTACSLLHNTNEQLSRTDKHMKRWPSKLFLSSLKASTLPVRLPVQPNMHVFWSPWGRQVDSTSYACIEPVIYRTNRCLTLLLVLWTTITALLALHFFLHRHYPDIMRFQKSAIFYVSIRGHQSSLAVHTVVQEFA